MTTSELPQNINWILGKTSASFRQDFSEFICYIASNGADSDLGVLSNIGRRINYAFEDEGGHMLCRSITTAERKALLQYYKTIWKEAYSE